MADMPGFVREDGRVASARGPRADRPKRRTFTAAYKLAIVEQYDQLTDARERGALLRREGLYHSHIQQWREAIEKGTLPALPPSRPGGLRAARRRWITSGCGRRTRNSPLSWPGRRPRLRSREKHTRSWRSLRERGFRQEAAQVISEALTGLEPFTPVRTACALLGKPRATLHRQRNPRQAREMPPGPRAAHPAALSPGEQEQLLAVLNADRFADKSPAQVWAVLLDEGTYLASVSTMYRVLRAADQVRERRAQAAHPARVRPELTADGPDQVWTWDITKLKGPVAGRLLRPVRDARHLLPQGHALGSARHRERRSRPSIHRARHHQQRRRRTGAIHADRGTSMTSKPVAALLADLHISQSHSRPHVSNDNPYSEAQFKTLKYCPAFPGQFGSMPDARAFCDVFFAYYNNEHRHSGIGLYTPASVHDGTARPSRPTGPGPRRTPTPPTPAGSAGAPAPPALPAKVWINQPRRKIETTGDITKNQAA